MIKQLILISLFSVWISRSQAYPCPEILFGYISNNPVEVLPQELIIKWSYNTGCEGHKNRSNKFVIERKNIYDDVILLDTINDFNYTIKPEDLDSVTGVTIFSVRELGDEDKYSLVLKNSKSTSLIVSENLTERLNTYLLNGYFLNALAIVEKLNRQDLIREISEQFLLLFPPNYPDECNFFNAYLSFESSRLITMPYVTGLSDFIKDLNKRTKEGYIRRDPFIIELLISPKNRVVSYEIKPLKHQDIVNELIENLTFNNNFNENILVLIKIGKSKNGKKYEIYNERALIDPNSKGFRKKFPYKGAIH